MVIQTIDDFEDGDVSEWTVGASSVVWETQSSPARGTQSGRFEGGNTADGSWDLAWRTVASGGAQIGTFEFYFQETSNNNGAALSLFDSNKNRVLSIGTNNPQWAVWDGSGNITDWYSGDGYDRWIRFTVSFDWGAGEYTVTGEDVSSGSTASHTASLINTTSVEYVSLGRPTGTSATCAWWVDDLAYEGTPAAPSNLTVTQQETTTHRLDWDDNSSSEDGFRIHITNESTGTTHTETVGANTTQYTHSGAEDTHYSYYITAYNTAGESGASNTVSATTSLHAPDVSASVVANDAVDVSVTDNSSSENDVQVQMNRDGEGWVSPAGGPSTLPAQSGTGTTMTETYGAASDAAYGQQVGIDSSIQFRARARGDTANSDWASSGTVYTDPIPPHQPTATREQEPNGVSASNTIRLQWTNRSDIHDHVEIQAREDTGGGYGAWGAVSATDPDDNFWLTTEGSGGYNPLLKTDARYQIRLRTVAADGSTSEWVHADYGSEGRVFFKDDFESGGPSWTGGAVYGSTGTKSSSFNEGDADMGISGPGSGSQYMFLESGSEFYKDLGDLSGESDVLVKAVVANGSLDSSSETNRIQWYDGTVWQTLRSFGPEYNKQGWTEVSVVVPDSYLSTDNRVKINAYDSGGTGDYFAVDRFVVSDILHEYTLPTATSGESTDASTEGELTGDWTVNNSFGGTRAKLRRDDTTVENIDGPPSVTFTGLRDGERYELQTVAEVDQPRHGSVSSTWKHWTTGIYATTVLPAPTGLVETGHGTTTISIDWTNHHDYGEVRIDYRPTTPDGEPDEPWQEHDTVSRETEGITIDGLRTGEDYEIRVVAVTEHTKTEGK